MPESSGVDLQRRISRALRRAFIGYSFPQLKLEALLACAFGASDGVSSQPRPNPRLVAPRRHVITLTPPDFSDNQRFFKLVWLPWLTAR